MRVKIEKMAKRVLSGESLNAEEGQALIEAPAKDIYFLFAWANQIRQTFVSSEIDLCEIYNGRSGKCSEDCRYCAQSAHYRTDVKEYPLASEADFLRAAEQAEQDGSRRFSIVTSGPGGKDDKDFHQLLRTYEKLSSATSLKLCASLGSLTMEKAKALKDAGVVRYHHNIETSPNYYRKICTTHTFSERIETIKYAQAAGLEVCSGGILGMGESLTDRVEMALILRELKVDCVPLNILTPIQGTPLQNQTALHPLDYLRAVAAFRFLLPQAGIRSAGGRERHMRDLQSLILTSGADGMMIGGYLTTEGRDVRQDWQMFSDLEMNVCDGVR